MPIVTRSVLVAHSAGAMFKLVDRVEDYPQFLPWCGGSEVLTRNDRITLARVDIDFRGLKQSFTTENTKVANESMQLKLVDGPFSALNGSWRFSPLTEAACKVVLELDYGFHNAAWEQVVGPVFQVITETLVDRFVTRADALSLK
jgi:ribosome-associated toxin RatA of RatAB toxin-antitoxin module